MEGVAEGVEGEISSSYKNSSSGNPLVSVVVSEGVF